MQIGDHKIGAGRCFIIAEGGVNHDGREEDALAIVDAAADCGADAVKFQTFDPGLLASPAARKAQYQIETTAGENSQRAMLDKLALPAAAFARMRARCIERRVTFLSTPFDETSVQMLEDLGVPAWKVSSGDLNNFPLLAQMAATGLPMILSTGMATLDEVRAAVAWVKRNGATDLALLQCVSNYPANAKDTNLRVMADYRARFGVEVGYSDHTLGIAIPIAAAALGASIIEKHFTLDCSRQGPDHRASLEPREFAAMVAGVREVEQALGDGAKAPTASELEMRVAARRSLHWKRALSKGAIPSSDDFIALRPGGGIPPSEIASLQSRQLNRDVAAEAPVAQEDFR